MTSVLVVCLGNICRSPMAEGVLRARALTRGQTLTVDSAGTGQWHIGDPPDRRAERAAKTRGYDISTQRARQITVEDFHRFDHILVMDHDNLANCKRLQPTGSPAQLALFLQGRDVPDPYYEGGFDSVLDLIEAGAEAWLETL